MASADTSVAVDMPASVRTRVTRQSLRGTETRQGPNYVESNSEEESDAPVRKKRKIKHRGKPRVTAAAVILPEATKPPRLSPPPQISIRDEYILRLLDSSNARNSSCPYSRRVDRGPRPSPSLALLLNDDSMDFDDAESRAPLFLVTASVDEEGLEQRSMYAQQDSSVLPRGSTSTETSTGYFFSHAPAVCATLRPATWQPHELHNAYQPAEGLQSAHASFDAEWLHFASRSPPRQAAAGGSNTSLQPSGTAPPHSLTRTRSMSDSSRSSVSDSTFPATPSPRNPTPALQASPAVTAASKSASWFHTVLGSAMPSPPVTAIQTVGPSPTSQSNQVGSRCWQCTTIGRDGCSRHRVQTPLPAVS